MDQEIIHDFYMMTLVDLVNGASIRQLQKELKNYEKAELYEECVGIRNGINAARKKTIEEIKLIIVENEIRNDLKHSREDY